MPAWLDKLNEQQSLYANKIADKAQQMGVPPQLALALAYHESGFDPRKIGEAKEIGLMQVLPSTGKMLGYSPNDLADPDKNIEAGLKYLKQHLDTYGGAQELAALAYNRGPGVASKFIAGESDPAGEKYVKAVGTLGGFAGQPAPEPAEPEAEPEPTPEQKAAMAQQRQERNEEAERMAAAGLGGGAGLLKEGVPVVKGVVAKTLQALASAAAQQPQAGAQVAQQAAQAAAPAAATSAAPAVAPQAPEARATGPGSAVYNYARKHGLTEIEAQRALDTTKQQGGVWDLLGQRRESTMDIRNRFPSETYVENPRFGGLMTPDYTQFGGPRAPGAPRPAPIPTAPVQPSGLQQVTQTFQRMMGSPAARVANRVLTPLGLAGAGYEGVGAYQEATRPIPNIPLALAKGTAALGGALSAFRPTAPVGIPVGILGSAAEQQLQELANRAIPPEPARRMMGRSPLDQAGMIQSYSGTMTSPF